ncbi:hypothetical protein PIB30_037361 [Stylosanthes scabra]|uniref:NAC domain-containing protein n=1 Tax=Stylosanthes scabra TaxID=79078 RepID=A0ABU6UEZ8_9FABA|nr:hypothetical protein [Stylosanthes scabra]
MAELNAAASFKPSDEQLIHFLSDKLKAQPMDDNAAINIHECDYLYGRTKNPWDIWRDFAGDVDAGRTVLFFFSPNKKHPSPASRPIGAGVWEAQAENIEGEAIIGNKGKNRRIGTKKCFSFEKSGTSYDGAWSLHEYTLHGSLHYTNNTSVITVNQCILVQGDNNSYVICKLIKNREVEVEAQVGDKRKRHSNAQSATTGVHVEHNAPHAHRNTKDQEVQFTPNELGRQMLLDTFDGLTVTNENVIRNLMQRGGTRRGGKSL